MRPGGALKKAKKEKEERKKGKKLRDVTSHIFAQTTHVGLPPPKLSCMMGSRTESTMPSFIKIGSGVFASRGVEMCHFAMTLWLI